MLDINLFREEKKNNPEIIRDSQRKRFADVEVVDEIINLDKEWRQRQFGVDEFRKEYNNLNKEVKKLKISGADATEKIQQIKKNRQDAAEEEVEVREKYADLKSKLETVGNLIDDSVIVSNDEKDNAVIKLWGESEKLIASPGQKLKNYVDLVELLDIADTKRGAEIAGERGFFLKGDGLLLNQALINFGLTFLKERGFTGLQPPFFMRKNVMAKCAQLSESDEQLYEVTGEGDDKYLISTAEQPLCAYHIDERIHPRELPIRYAGYSSCFRKEAASHGKDPLGIFRVHQFEKIEQFCITSPNGNDSSAMFDEMMKNSEDFYQALELPYRVVSIVSGALNLAAAKMYDLEAWFPSSETYRELVSCSNCTDYQARTLEIRYGQKKTKQTKQTKETDETKETNETKETEETKETKEPKQYVHMLNSTLTATERTICCILENCQREDGVEIPKVLQPFMGGKTFLPFKANDTKGKNTDSGADTTELIQEMEKEKQDATEKEEVREADMKAKPETVNNLIHDSVPDFEDEADNDVIRLWGDKRVASPGGEKLKNHVDLVELLDIVDTKRGAEVAGGRGYFLKGDGLLLNQALINFGLAFLKDKNFTLLQPPFFMRKDVMAKCAQLADFDEQLYKVTGDGDDKYLIATAEQPLCAYHSGEWIHPSELPIRYAGYSSCFRKEAASHGRDTLGIFRVHQFEKIEQFCITSPNENDSWKMLEEMMENSEHFYQKLKLPYRVVSIVSEELNDAAAKKYDLEAWFPSSETYRELVSCSNCTDYQSRRLEIRYGQEQKSDEEKKQYVHMLNSTLTATERTICCILENYQCEDGVKIPDALQPFMGGQQFLPFKTKPVVVADTKGKKTKT